MNFALDEKNDLLLEQSKAIAGATFAMVGGRISRGIMAEADEIVQAIKNELLLWSNEHLLLLGRGTDWFTLFRDSKLQGARALQQEISRVILSIRSVSEILELNVLQYPNRHFYLQFKCSTRASEIIEGTMDLGFAS